MVVIGYDVWQTRFGGDPGVVGRGIRLGSTMHTVVGVMPEGLAFPMNHQFWTPLRADPAGFARREGPGIFIFGRLAQGVTMDAAQAELEAIGRRTAATFPETHAQLRPMVMPYTHSLTDIQGMTIWMVVQMQLMMSLLLIVVALNVAVLVYARTARRRDRAGGAAPAGVTLCSERSQPDMSDLVRGNLGRFSMERLERFLKVLDAAGELCNLSPTA